MYEKKCIIYVYHTIIISINLLFLLLCIYLKKESYFLMNIKEQGGKK